MALPFLHVPATLTEMCEKQLFDVFITSAYATVLFQLRMWAYVNTRVLSIISHVNS